MKQTLNLIVIIFCFMGYESNGQSYIGTRYESGGDGLGEIFQMNENGVISNHKYLTSDYSGIRPAGKSVQAANGKLYGLTSTTGSGKGFVLFEYDYTTGVYTVRHRFNSSASSNGLIKGSNGKLYGKYYNQGTVVFSYSTSTNIYSELDTIPNCYSGEPLKQATNGNIYFYSISTDNNQTERITMFDTTTKNSFHVYVFNLTIDGKEPQQGLEQHSNGKLYGVTSYGGVNSNGVIFEFNPTTNTYTKKIDLSNSDFIAYSSFTLASNGNFLLAMLYGIYEYNPTTNTLSLKISVASSSKQLLGNLTLTSNGVYYGIARDYTNDQDYIYKYNYILNTLDSISAIDTYTSNFLPPSCETANLLFASNGKLYGSGRGNSFYELNVSTNISTRKFIFNTSLLGEHPSGDVVKHCNGKYYGVTKGGGSNKVGTIYEYNAITSTYTKKKDFIGTNGAEPYGEMKLAPNGKLYGISRSGGDSSQGNIFEYNVTANTLISKFSFTKTSGIYPICMILKDSILYGVTLNDSLDYGYPQGEGSFFKYNLNTNSYVKLASLGANDFGFNLGLSRLVDGNNGNLYFATYFDDLMGSNPILYIYNIATNTLTTDNNITGYSISKPINHFIYCAEASLKRFNTITNLTDMNFTSPFVPGSGFVVTNNNILLGHNASFNLTNQTTTNFNNFIDSLYWPNYNYPVSNYYSGLVYHTNNIYGFLGPDITKIILPNQKRNLTNLVSFPGASYIYRKSNWTVMTTPTLAPAGNYYIIGNTPSGCIDTVKVTVKTGAVPSLKYVNEDETVDDINTEPIIYPNPFADVLNVEFNLVTPSKLKIDILDIQGKLINSVESYVTEGANTIKINTSNLTAGMYFIKIIENGEQKSVQKIIKE